MPEPDAEGLIALQRAHRLSIPFENLDIALGRGISLDPDTVFDKLVARQRGGYCFEHNALFLPALREIGFAARALLARVWLGAETVPARTHTFSLVEIDGTAWIADPGFGGSYTPPMPLIEGEEALTPDGARHRLVTHPEHGWMLERLGTAETTDGRGAGHEGWMPQYSFTLDEVWPTDLAMSNHFTQTIPGGRFVDNRIVSIVLPNGFASIFNRDYSRASLKGRESAEIVNARAYRMRLSLMFGIHLTAEEVARLGLFDE